MLRSRPTGRDRASHPASRLAPLLLWLIVGGCAAREAAPERWNIVVVSIDSLRRDRLRCYGYSKPVSPAIDRLAAEGIEFTNVLSQSAWTLPAHTSLFTSQHVFRHGVVHGKSRLPDRATTLAEILAAAGYGTAAVVSGPFLLEQFGLAQGFDLYDVSAVTRSRKESHHVRAGPKTNRAALGFIESAPAEPFFLFLHYWDVHYDYQPPEPFARIFYAGDPPREFVDFISDSTVDASLDDDEMAALSALYDGEIRYTDGLLADLLAALDAKGLLDRTLIVVTADHGDEFFEHGGKGHRKTLYEELVRIPLIVRFPDRRWSGTLVDDRVQLIDVFPTILDAIGVSLPKHGIDGESLLPRMRGDDVQNGELRPRISETGAGRGKGSNRPPAEIVSVEVAAHKLIMRKDGSGEGELYDLEQDPAERIDLAQEQSELSSQLSRLFRQIERRAPRQASTDTVAIDPALEEELRALGYLD